MSYDLEYIKKLRVKLCISQKELASQCRISASMLNQIEKGTAKPSFDTAKVIFNYLETKKFSNQKKASDIYTRPIITLGPLDTLGRVIEKMKDHEFSQIPVVNTKKCVGIVTEGGIAKHTDNPNYTRTTKISKIMKSIPPIFDLNFSAGALKDIVSISGCVLITEKNNIVGIITSQDLLKLIT
ncbi:putative transcriptional regulator, XRE family [Nitrosotalea devaniterrae]|uniref:Putative transcriptional regulator, XRE family n=1 Tax=Nitrosotalea devaniterrae TaxID=1078905 RepID=A0A128A4F3_9ARCH|nr:putative transcriptional regulator, XRE family [Candidatus Nitrosotalea devanaterra]